MSNLRTSISAVLNRVKSVRYNWGDLAIAKVNPQQLFQTVLMWNNQVMREREGNGYTFEKPACFLEVVTVNSIQLLNGVTQDDKIWRLHIVDRELDAGDGNMDQNLDVFGFRDLVKTAFGGFQPPNCSTLFYVNERQDYDHDSVYHYILEFKSAFTDKKGSILERYIYKAPPTNLELEIGFDTSVAPSGDPLVVYIWKVCKVMAQLVAEPNPDNTQLLDNGVTIPLEYTPHDPIYDSEDNIVAYKKLTIPYLISTPGISILTPFLIDGGGLVQDIAYDPATGTFDNEANGGFVLTNNISFNASLPLGVD